MNEKPGAIIVDTPARMLYLVLDDRKAMRYGIGVGREGFTWSGSAEISAKREWPEWIPPKEMLARRPERVLREAVRRMVPRNRLGRQQMTKLKIYAGATHPHQAQNPQDYKLPS